MLERVKRLLGLNNAESDELIKEIIKTTEQRLKNRLGGLDIPEALEFVVLEVSVKRFNRIGSEGFASHSVEGESVSWNEDDFKPYESDILSYLKTLKTNKKGRIRFI